MELPRLSESVVRVVRLEKDAGGGLRPVVIFQKPQAKKKKGSPVLKSLDKGVRRLVKAERAMLDAYQSRHDESNSRRKDGWVIDLAPNVLESARSARKKLKLNRLSVF